MIRKNLFTKGFVPISIAHLSVKNISYGIKAIYLPISIYTFSDAHSQIYMHMQWSLFWGYSSLLVENCFIIFSNIDIKFNITIM